MNVITVYKTKKNLVLMDCYISNLASYKRKHYKVNRIYIKFPLTKKKVISALTKNDWPIRNNQIRHPALTWFEYLVPKDIIKDNDVQLILKLM